MKRALRSILAFVIVFAVFTGLIFLFFPEVLYQRFYFGSRIKAAVSISVDGTEVPLSDCDISCFLNVSQPQDMKFSGRNMTLRGDNAGTYNWTVLTDDTELRFYIDKSDSKSCISFDMDFGIDTKERTITYNGWIMQTSDGILKRKKVPVSGVYSLDYEHHSIGVFIHE